MHPLLLVGGPLALLGGGVYYFRDKLFGKKTSAPGAPKGGPPETPSTPATPPAHADKPMAPPVSPEPPPPADAPVIPPQPTDVPMKATVTTNDPPPMGDLIVMPGPSKSGTQIGGVDKGGSVDVITWNAGVADGYTWSYIRWGGGRWPAVQGYVKQKYLKQGV